VCGVPAPIGIVVATRNRRHSLLRTLARLRALPERPPVVVVDNASGDGTAEAVRAVHPDVEVVALPRNLGGGARTVGARALDTGAVAFSDDDSWWEPGSLARAARLLDAHPRLALIAARILVGREGRLDPTSEAMANSPLVAPDGLPGRPVLGFVACGAIARRRAFLEAGGFEPRLGIGGEEQLLALDLAAAGWQLAYVPDVVARHHPGDGGRDGRSATELRNLLWTAWLRRRAPAALARTASIAASALRERQPGALLAAARGLPWALRNRRAVPPEVERAARRLHLP
jgi:GT2 family glycosyltransferase